ncbi:MAG: MopE-related protein, partial [Nanoarchaeota archaeon]
SCIAGVWSSCSAIFPAEELCGDGLDDDCDGAVDESCGRQELSKDEIALKQFLDIKFGRDKYEFNKYLEQARDTKDFVRLRKSSVVSDGKTKIRLVFVPIRTLYNFTVFEYIPKTIASSSGDVVFSVEPDIIQSDPLVAWHFAEVDGKLEISYEVNGEFDDASEKTATISFAESSAELKNPWYFDFLPVLIIPVLGLVFIVLVEVVRKRDKV